MTNKVSHTTLYCKQYYITYKKSLHLAAHPQTLQLKKY